MPAPKQVEVEVDGRRLVLSNLDKPMYPTGFTKAEVIRWATAIGPVLLPHLADRALTMERYPDGSLGQFFYEKRRPTHAPGWVSTVDVWVSGGSARWGGREGTGAQGWVPMVVVDWLATLVWPGPDHDDRVARLRAAAAVVASAPPEIIRGDLLETVTDAAAQAPADATIVVFHSAVLLYLDAEGRQRFADIMAGLGEAVDRKVLWLSNETTGTYPAVDAQLPPGIRTDHRFVQTIDGHPVALAGQHGAVYETRPFRRIGV